MALHPFAIRALQGSNALHCAPQISLPVRHAKSRPPICLTDLLGRLLKALAKRDRWGWTDKQAEGRAPLVTSQLSTEGREEGRKFSADKQQAIFELSEGLNCHEAPWADGTGLYLSTSSWKHRTRRNRAGWWYTLTACVRKNYGNVMQSSAWCHLTRQKHLNTLAIPLSGKQRGHLGWVGLWVFWQEQSRSNPVTLQRHPTVCSTQRQVDMPPQNLAGYWNVLPYIFRRCGIQLKPEWKI